MFIEYQNSCVEEGIKIFPIKKKKKRKKRGIEIKWLTEHYAELFMVQNRAYSNFFFGEGGCCGVWGWGWGSLHPNKNLKLVGKSIIA